MDAAGRNHRRKADQMQSSLGLARMEGHVTRFPFAKTVTREVFAAKRNMRQCHIPDALWERSSLWDT